ncbi:unnamed protein product [Chrysoparadoxa australica]
MKRHMDHGRSMPPQHQPYKGSSYSQRGPRSAPPGSTYPQGGPEGGPGPRSAPPGSRYHQGGHEGGPRSSLRGQNYPQGGSREGPRSAPSGQSYSQGGPPGGRQGGPQGGGGYQRGPPTQQSGYNPSGPPITQGHQPAGGSGGRGVPPAGTGERVPAGTRESDMRSRLVPIETALGHRFSNEDLLLQALTSKAYCRENPSSNASCEDLEWLGDSLLQAAVSDWLFRTTTDDRSPARLSSLRQRYVDAGACTYFSEHFGIPKAMRLGLGQQGQEVAKMTESCFRAVLGAVHVDSDGSADSIKAVMGKVVPNFGKGEATGEVVTVGSAGPGSFGNPRALMNGAYRVAQAAPYASVSQEGWSSWATVVDEYGHLLGTHQHGVLRDGMFSASQSEVFSDTYGPDAATFFSNVMTADAKKLDDVMMGNAFLRQCFLDAPVGAERVVMQVISIPPRERDAWFSSLEYMYNTLLQSEAGHVLQLLRTPPGNSVLSLLHRVLEQSTSNLAFSGYQRSQASSWFAALNSMAPELTSGSGGGHGGPMNQKQPPTMNQGYPPQAPAQGYGPGPGPGPGPDPGPGPGPGPLPGPAHSPGPAHGPGLNIGGMGGGGPPMMGPGGPVPAQPPHAPYQGQGPGPGQGQSRPYNGGGPGGPGGPSQGNRGYHGGPSGGGLGGPGGYGGGGSGGGYPPPQGPMPGGGGGYQGNYPPGRGPGGGRDGGRPSGGPPMGGGRGMGGRGGGRW